jgi:uncharacterized protein (TIGR03437 family)
MVYEVANAASWTSGPVAPGEAISITGAKMGTQTASSSSLPLPIQLAGVSALVNGAPTPLYYVSPTQINAEVPYGVSAGSATVVVTTPLGNTAFVSLPLSASAPGLFSGPNSEVLVDASTGQWTQAPAVAGKAALQFATGLGATAPPVQAGAPAPANPLSVVAGTVTENLCGVPAQILWAGLAPGFAGLYQINVMVPDACATAKTTNPQITVQ